MKLSVEVYIKKNTLEISGKANADNTSPFLTISNNLTMTANQYAGFYVKITSGDSAGLVSWILSNTQTILNLLLFQHQRITIKYYHIGMKAVLIMALTIECVMMLI